MKDWMRGRTPLLAAGAAVLLVIVGAVFLIPHGEKPAAPEGDKKNVAAEWPPDPFPSTYKALPAAPTLIRNATILTGTGDEIAGGSVLIENGKISEVATNIGVPAGATVIDGKGKFVKIGRASCRERVYVLV